MVDVRPCYLYCYRVIHTHTNKLIYQVHTYVVQSYRNSTNCNTLNPPWIQSYPNPNPVYSGISTVVVVKIMETVHATPNGEPLSSTTIYQVLYSFGMIERPQEDGLASNNDV